MRKPPSPKQQKTASRGFTILETLVAIGILVISITGPMVFAQQSLRAARLSRDQVTGFYLAQDAVEFVKHVRDENSLTDSRPNWLVGLEECAADDADPDAGGCQISTPEWDGTSTAGAVEACPDSDCPIFEEETNGGAGRLYGIFGATGDASRFSRRVKIMTPEGGDPTGETEEVLVEVRVWWNTVGIDNQREVLVREHVYNWIQ